jgi:hypothetical protein
MRHGEILKVALELAMRLETESAHNSDDGGGIAAQAVGRAAYGKQHKFSGTLECWTNHFLALRAEMREELLRAPALSVGFRVTEDFRGTAPWLRSIP